jgi:SEC-C motif domain protein
MSCPCGSNVDFDLCCGPFLSGERRAPTAEALMRSRYTAYTRRDIDYLGRTLAPESRGDFDPSAAMVWAAESKWSGLAILSTEGGRASDDAGVVEFVATYRQKSETIAHHEISRFRKTTEGEWFFVQGVPGARLSSTDRRNVSEATKVGRNDPCPCGSGRKYKKCCAA